MANLKSGKKRTFGHSRALSIGLIFSFPALPLSSRPR